MKYQELRKKYPRFIYEKYSYKISGNSLEIFFNFKIEHFNKLKNLLKGDMNRRFIEPDIRFKPKVIVKNIDKSRLATIGDRTLNNLIFHLGLMEIPSYWKATCSPKIIIKAGPLSMKASPSSPSSTNLRFISINKEQTKWWKDLIINGMGQFFYENKINFKKPNFLEISFTSYNSYNFAREAIPCRKNKILIPVGGGKDSAVTLEILKKNKKQINCFSLNPTEAAKKIMEIAGCKNPIVVRRKIDEKLLALNRRGFLNGHTPFSAYLAFLSVLVAAIFDVKYIAFSNERSSNEGNVKYLGKIINHQYSKSFDFEKKFRKYSKKYLSKVVKEDKSSFPPSSRKRDSVIEYFSFLRPLYEIQIAKLFSWVASGWRPKYFSAFLSCNEAYKTASGTKKPTKKWCRKCSKCLFVFAILYPFIKEKELLKIFGKNLFENKKLLPIMQELVGEKRFKPFECVGTKKESLVAFYLALRSFMRRRVKLPFLLEYFQNEILPKYPNLEKESKKILDSWNNQHNLPREFEKNLKKVVS